MRHALFFAASLLSAQAAIPNGPVWDVLQETTSGAERLVVSAVQSDVGVQRINVKPTRLRPETLYEIHSLDSGLLGTATGTDLMASGIDVVNSSATAAHILILKAKQ